MASQTLSGLLAGDYAGTKHLRLTSANLTAFPNEILSLAPSLEQLDLSSNPLSELPADFHLLSNLKIAFFSDCRFTVFPPQLAQCPNLEMVAFRGNGMHAIPEGAFPPQLRWLILTNNEIEAIPRSVGLCTRLQKAMLAGNKLTTLPEEMANCHNLGLLRLSANNLTNIPSWLFALPSLAFLSFAGNPCAPTLAGTTTPTLEDIPWPSLTIDSVLGEGASGIISAGTWNPTPGHETLLPVPVAIKLFKGAFTSDGAPADEMSACLAAGAHPHLISPLGRISGHPSGASGLVLQLVPPHFSNLGLPPSLQSCSRDVFPEDMKLTLAVVLRVLKGVAAAAEHLHQRGVAHGDLYAHNLLLDSEGNALLGDFGAATVYAGLERDGVGKGMEALEVLAFGNLVEDLLGLVEDKDMIGEVEKEEVGEGERGEEQRVKDLLVGLQAWCARPVVVERPGFKDVRTVLEGL